jgi:hypothetical protein
MKRKAATGLPAARRISSAANEDFTATADGVDGLEERPQAGWNPYEVWRTRVKESSESSGMPEHDPDSFH